MFVNTYRFDVHYKKPNATRWRCHNYKKLGCRVGLVTFAGNTIKFCKNSEHNHKPDPLPADDKLVRLQGVRILK